VNRSLAHFFRFQFPALLWAGFIFWISSIPAHRLPKFAHLLNDKIVHAGTFFVLGLLIYRALAPVTTPKLFRWPRLVTAVFAVVIYGFLDEFHQAYVPGRSVDIWDATADAIGGLLAAAVIVLITRRHRSAA
jgi:VanZ family protein